MTVFVQKLVARQYITLGTFDLFFFGLDTADTHLMITEVVLTCDKNATQVLWGDVSEPNATHGTFRHVMRRITKDRLGYVSLLGVAVSQVGALHQFLKSR